MAEELSGTSGFQGQRRLPYTDKSISEITHGDIKARFAGIIIEKSGDTLIVDDGSGQVKVASSDSEDFSLNQTVRVFAKIMPVMGGVEASAEIIQDITGTDMDLYRKAAKAEKDLEV